MRIRIGTRGSALARAQAAAVARALAELGHESELVVIRTAGDESAATSFASIGPQGVFVREIEQALIDGRADIAVHSCKDLPTRSPERLAVVAVPKRADPADVLIANRRAADPGQGVLPLKRGAVVGTASARRQSWLRALRPDLTLKPVRGNVPTRIGKLSGDYDAILLAAAGIERLTAAATESSRLALEALALTRLEPRDFVPAPAQGALALQCRRDAEAIVAALERLDDAVSHACVRAERSVLARVEGGCDLALGAYCAPADGGYELVAALERGGEVLTERAAGETPAALAEAVWAALAGR